MRRRLELWVLFTMLAVAGAWAQPDKKSTVPTNEEIRAVLADRIDVQKTSVGIVVGVIEPAGRRVVAYGSLAKGNGRALDGDTVFEIGSVTKVFTSLVLADMVQRGEAAFDDPVAKYLPEQVKVPERAGRSITLEDLSRHMSALPRLPSNLVLRNMSNPYAEYSVEQLYEFLSAHELSRDIGSKYEYSNLGVGLLGHALARRAGADYESLVKVRVLEPLGMKSTSITLSPEMKARLATGHTKTGSRFPTGIYRRWPAPARCDRAPTICCASSRRILVPPRRRWLQRWRLCSAPGARQARPTWRSLALGTFRQRTALRSYLTAAEREATGRS